MSKSSPAIVRTVCGDIAPHALGICYTHEHLLGAPPAEMATDDLSLDNEGAAERELRLFRKAGGQAIVEMTTPDYGRNAAGLQRLAQTTGIHLIAATGYNKETFSAPYLQNASVEELTARFIQEVTVGMDGTKIRAGLIKASSTLNTISPLARKLFHAAAQAHLATGAPISTHTEAGTMALEQVTLLKQEGVSAERIIIGHTDRNLDWNLHLALVESDVYLGYDQIGKEKYDPDQRRAEFIVRLIAKGYGKQILLGSDLARRSYWHSYGTEKAIGFTHILERFVPLLQKCGASGAEIIDLLLRNPASALSFAPYSN